jgi:hypothetical protein
VVVVVRVGDVLFMVRSDIIIIIKTVVEMKIVWLGWGAAPTGSLSCDANFK